MNSVRSYEKAAKSICLNIAEGYGRRMYEKDFAKFLINALRSVNETQVCLDFAFDLGYLNEEKYNYFIQDTIC
jgi:four helix bundle protein